ARSVGGAEPGPAGGPPENRSGEGPRGGCLARRLQQAACGHRLDTILFARSDIGRYVGLLEGIMKIAVIGTGYVGMVTGTCLAESGNDVVGIDKDAAKIAVLESGRLPIYEPGLLELVVRNRREDRLRFTTDLAKGCAGARLIFIAVGTPQSPDGASDLSSVWAVADGLAGVLAPGQVVVMKSTVPVG